MTQLRRPRPFVAICRLGLVIGAIVMLSLTGCLQVRYGAQAAYGELELLSQARPLDQALRDSSLSERVRRLLAEVPAVKRWAAQHGLTATSNYESFVQLDRRAVVWVVSACDPLRFRSETWWFPIVGRVPYLGWFERAAADRFAESLRRRGLDVDVRGARAFSTLGWFSDPLLSSMIPRGREALGELVDVVLHESLHATIYVKGQTHFNESLASFVAEHLAIDYLVETRGAAAAETTAYHAAQAAQAARGRALEAAYGQLKELYRSPRSDAEKRTEKMRILSALQDQLALGRPINNATLQQFRAYGSGRAELEALLGACTGNWSCFFRAVGSVRPSAFTETNQADLSPVLEPLVRTVRPLRAG